MPIGPPSPKKRMGVRQPETLRSSIHKAWIRKQPCVCRGSKFDEWMCGGPVEAAHFRSATGGGMGLKPGDQWTFPACNGHHRIQHQVGERTFQAMCRLDLRAICQSYAARSPDQRIRETVR